MEKNPQQKRQSPAVSRREFMKAGAAAGMASLMIGSAGTYARGSDTLRVGLIGCGGRGTGAGIIDCAESSKGVELVAIGDVFSDHVESAPERIKNNLRKRKLPVKEIYKVTSDTIFSGFDAYKKVLECDIDMVILTEPPYFRPAHYQAAVETGKHVFMEKPVAVDPVGVRSVIKTSKLADEKRLSVVAGTQSRRMRHIMAFMERIHAGDIGKIQGGQCIRMGGGLMNWRSHERKRKSQWSDYEWQLRRWLFVTWLSGDFLVEQHVHNLDLVNWALQAVPVSCMGTGGRQARIGEEYGNIYDHFAVDYEYPNGVRIAYMGRQIDKCSNRSAIRLMGRQGVGYVDHGNGIIEGDKPFKYDGPSVKAQVQEYADLIASVRKAEPINEGKRIAESTMMCIMGRMSAYTGRALSWDWAMNASKLDLSPKKDEFGELPLAPVAIPGQTKLI